MPCRNATYASKIHLLDGDPAPVDVGGAHGLGQAVQHDVGLVRDHRGHLANREDIRQVADQVSPSGL